MRKTIRSRIGAAARELFLQEGIDGVSMRRIARQVGVSATAIYRHYADKGELLEELTEEGYRIFGEYLRRVPQSGTALDRIRALADRSLDFALDCPRHYDFIFIVPRQKVRRFPGELTKDRAFTFNVLADAVKASLEAELLKPDDPIEVSLSIWAHVHGMVSLHRAGRFGTNTERFRDLYRRSVARLLAGLAR